MKHLARTDPYRSSTIEFTNADDEDIDAIVLSKTKQKN